MGGHIVINYASRNYRRICLVLGVLAVIIASESAKPAQAVFDQTGVNSCIDCHAKLSDKRLSQPVDLWGASVHAEVGNTCDGCHGGDPEDSTLNSMSKKNDFYAAPAEEEIVNFCGKCHRELADNFQTSEHAITETQNCIGCHGSHTIRRISIEIINEEKCGECHDYEKADKIKTVLQTLHNQFQNLGGKIKLISGFPINKINEDMKKNWTQLRRVRMISHTFDIQKLEAQAMKVSNALDRSDAEIDRLLEMSNNRKLWGYGAVLIFSLLALVTWKCNRWRERK